MFCYFLHYFIHFMTEKKVVLALKIDLDQQTACGAHVRFFEIYNTSLSEYNQSYYRDHLSCYSF